MRTITRRRNARRYWRRIAALSLIWLMPYSSTSWAFGDDGPGDFLLFPRLHYDKFDSAPPQLDLDNEEFAASTSAFYAKNNGRLRFLGEFFLSEDESEVERLQIGWSLNEKTSTWLGRFHTPVGFWNQEYHHGAYLVTSVTRPSIIEFEDDGGILPTHQTGLLVEGKKNRNNGIWDYSVAFGYAPKITDEGLHAVDVVDLSVSGHDPTFSAMLTYAPDEFGPLKFGAFYLATTLTSEITPIKEVEQNVIGAFFHGEWLHWRATTAYFILDNRVRAITGTSDSDFSTGYLQIDHMFTGTWTVFGRIEDSTGTKNDPYLTLFPEFITSRALLGVRYDVIKNHALTLEIGKVDLGMLDESYNHLSFQWSAFFQ